MVYRRDRAILASTDEANCINAARAIFILPSTTYPSPEMLDSDEYKYAKRKNHKRKQHNYNRVFAVLIITAIFIAISSSPKKNYISAYIQHVGKKRSDFWFGDVHPKVDYTKLPTIYPEFHSHPPIPEAEYIKMETLGNLLSKWDQDDIENPPSQFKEVLQHFDFRDDEQMEAALKFREAELPFKITNLPELLYSQQKWSVKYISDIFKKKGLRSIGPSIETGLTQSSKNNFFLFFTHGRWKKKIFGPFPTTNVNWNFFQWAEHARKADENLLGPNSPHYYFQAEVLQNERFNPESEQGSISRDLPSFSGSSPTFFNFDPKKSTGIQCRFGERGVTAATHYDTGRNMVAMILGAKRYILSPPNACKYLSIETMREHPSFRHSSLNFGRIKFLSRSPNQSDYITSKDERNALQEATKSPAIETILKQGEVLYIPSHWFHYITSLQMSAQCNTRSGRDDKGTESFGGFNDVLSCQ